MNKRSKNLVGSDVKVTTRRIRNLGSNSFYINIPHEFMEENGLKEGDEVIMIIGRTLKIELIDRGEEEFDRRSILC